MSESKIKPVIQVIQIECVGMSGESYTFNTYPKNHDFKDIGAIYIYTKRSPKSDKTHEQKALYIGKTKHLKTRLAEHQQQNDIPEDEYTHIGFIKENDEENRKYIERDLIDAIRPKYNIK